MKSILLALGVTAALSYAATPADQIKVPPGFKVELLKEAGERDGSWISMAADAEGRLYISPQGSIPETGFSKQSAWGGIARATVSSNGVEKWERVPIPVGDAMGMLWAFDSLYISGQGPEGRGIYRCKDTNGDSLPDEAVLWKAVRGGAGEHGAHALVLGPDGKSIYISHGNSTPLIEGVSPDSPYRNWGEDDLLPKLMDPVATFFDKLRSPYGYVLKTDENGTKWELFAGGFRNQYDHDFNEDGELFTYDSDMEWDRGLPWYRPTRVLHIVPGGEYGFREGSAKWPDWYADSLPPVVDVGLGCPTGVKFGTKATGWPEEYRKAFFICDWTFGRLLAVKMKEKGASYTAKNPLKSYTYPKDAEASADVETFLSGKGLPLTDIEFGKDGTMYLTVGGRGTQAALYRVRWTGEQKDQLSTNDAIQKEASRIGHSVIKRARVNWTTESPFADADTTGPMTLNENAATLDDFLSFHFVRSLEAKLRPSDYPAAIKKLAATAPTEVRPIDPAVKARLLKERKDLLARLRQELSLAQDTVEKRKLELWIASVLPEEDMFPKREVTELDVARENLRLSLALVRAGQGDIQALLLEALKAYPFSKLPDDEKLLKLRILTLTFARQGRPSDEWVKTGLEKLLAQYPAKGENAFKLNHELSQLLVWLSNPALGDETTPGDGATNVTLGPVANPGAKVHSGRKGAEFHTDLGREVIERTLKLMEAAPTQEEQIWYALCLRWAHGWTPAQREWYFRWFHEKAVKYTGGNSFAKFVDRIRADAEARVPAGEKVAIREWLGPMSTADSTQKMKTEQVVARPFVKAWTLADLEKALDELKDREPDIARGKKLYSETQCAQCHLFRDAGGTVGPDLTAIAQRFGRRDILEAIIDPNKAVSDQYAMITLTLRKGDGGQEQVSGLVTEETSGTITLLTDPLAGKSAHYYTNVVLRREKANVSIMPPALLFTCTPEEVADLLAYMGAK